MDEKPVVYERVSLPEGGLAYVPKDETLRGWRLRRRIIDPSGKFPYYDIEFEGVKAHAHATEGGLARAKRELERLATIRAAKARKERGDADV